MLNIKLSPFLKDIISTTATSFLSVLSIIFIMRFLAKGLGPEEFGAYSLARRIIANIIPVATLSIDIALARYVSMTKEKELQNSYILSSLFSTGPAFILLLIIALSVPGRLSFLIFHSHEYLNLYYASLFLIGGYIILIISYAFFRGIQNFNKANSLQLLLISIIPLAISYFFSNKKNSSLIMFLMGLTLYLSFIPLALIIIGLKWPRLTSIRSSIKVLLKYSLPRVPAGFVLAGLLTVGPFLAGLVLGLKEAGYFVIGQSVFRVFESAVVGFGLVALPKFSQSLAANDAGFLRSRIEDLLIMIFQLGIFITIHVFVWSKEIIQIWLGPQYMESVPIMKISILALAPYLGYVVLRSIIDAVEVRAVNTLNLLVSFVIVIMTSIIFIYTGFKIVGLATATTMGFFALGGLTIFYLMKRYKISFENFFLSWIVFLNILFLFIILLVKKLSGLIAGQLNIFIIIFITEAVLFIFYLYLLNKRKIRWLSEIKKRVFAES